MHLLEAIWLNTLNLIEQAIIRRTYLNATPPSILLVVGPLVLLGVLSTVSRAVFRAVRYVVFTAVCGAAFYFLLRTI